jgi:hypothetical protein
VLRCSFTFFYKCAACAVAQIFIFAYAENLVIAIVGFDVLALAVAALAELRVCGYLLLIILQFAAHGLEAPTRLAGLARLG